MLRLFGGISIGMFLTGWMWLNDPSFLADLGLSAPLTDNTPLGFTRFDINQSNIDRVDISLIVKTEDAPQSVAVINKQYVLEKDLWGSVGVFWGYGERNMTACREFVEFVRQALVGYPDPATFDCDMVQSR